MTHVLGIYMVNKLLIESSRQKDWAPHTSQHTVRPWGVVEERVSIERSLALFSPPPTPKSPSLRAAYIPPPFRGGDSLAVSLTNTQCSDTTTDSQYCNLWAAHLQSFHLNLGNDRQQSTLWHLSDSDMVHWKETDPFKGALYQGWALLIMSEFTREGDKVSSRGR